MAIPVTQTAVFFAYDIVMNGRKVGTLSRFNITGDKTIDRIREISTASQARVLELVPGVTNLSADVEKFRIYKLNLFEAIGLQIVSIEDLNTPFDIMETLTHPSQSTGSPPQEIITYHKCLLSAYGKTVTTGTSYVAETATIQISYISGSTGNAVATDTEDETTVLPPP